MAKLGKGILGAPTGIIGNVNCYNRLGKSIIQSRSFPVDSYHRRWNLLKWQLTNQLLFFWNAIPLAWQANWALVAPSGFTGYSYYLYSNLELLKSRKSATIADSVLYIAAGRNPISIVTAGSFEGRFISITCAQSDSFWSQTGVINLRFYKQTLAGLSFVVSFAYPSQPYFVINLQLPDSLFVDSLGVVLQLYRTAPSYLTQLPLTSLINPSNIY